MEDQREDGEDIDNWSFTSLQEMVKKYVNITGKPTADIDSEEDSASEGEISYKDSSDEENEDPLGADPVLEHKESDEEIEENKEEIVEAPVEEKMDDIEIQKSNVEKLIDVNEFQIRDRSNADRNMENIDENNKSIDSFVNIEEKKARKKSGKS